MAWHGLSLPFPHPSISPRATKHPSRAHARSFHYTKSWVHWVEMALKLETDPSEILNELIAAVRKVRGRV